VAKPSSGGTDIKMMLPIRPDAGDGYSRYTCQLAIKACVCVCSCCNNCIAVCLSSQFKGICNNFFTKLIKISF